MLYASVGKDATDLRKLKSMTCKEVNNILSILLGKETTNGIISRAGDNFITTCFKVEETYNEGELVEMGLNITENDDGIRVDYKWHYKREGGQGALTEPLYNHNKITLYLISRGFDVFGIIKDDII
jgi:hypothetical protein